MEMKDFDNKIELKDEKNNQKSEQIQFKQIEITYLEKKHKDFVKEKTTKLEYMNKILNTKKKKLKQFKGVYVFVLTKDFELTDDFFDDVYLYKKDKKAGEGNFEKVYCIASDYNRDKTSNKLVNNKVFYCGQSKEIFSRIYEHLTNSNYSGDKSLKLGFNSRAEIKKNLTCYIHLNNNKTKRSQIEKAIHDEYGYYFGDK